MFKKLKDKLAEEVKSSPQRIQQFAQAAQAAVTSASSSISDITNNDLFSIGDNDSSQNNPPRANTSPIKPQNTFQDVNLLQSPSDMDYTHELDSQRQRRLSNSSFTSDISFRLPNYETPSMYHLQSDMEVSASEADERGFSGGPATLDRVTKEQLYAAYKRTQERYKKYRTQYGDLARHYKLLERENAKARSVLVETQDKALRRISELKEQCSLEQSAKAHLEKALRVEIEEKNMKIDTLNTKVQLLQDPSQSNETDKTVDPKKITTEVNENNVQLINLSNDNTNEELASLNNKIEKMEQLLNKYKESLKTTKEKNSQITVELQKMSNELENKNKQVEELKNLEINLNESKKIIQELKDEKEELQNQVNTFDFNKTKEFSTLEIDLQRANEEIAELRSKIDVFSKREEEYAISLAENKLSIHKELESKEAEIKSLKDNLEASVKEIQSLKIVVTDYKHNISSLEEEKIKLKNECSEFNTIKIKCLEMETQLQDLSKKCQSLEQLKTKADEEYKCLQLQLKQETAEKMAMIDRNGYLETRNSQLSEDIAKKNKHIGSLESELQKSNNIKDVESDFEKEKMEKTQLIEEVNIWKDKCCKLESEIQEERVELVKLQAEIEKLLTNHELIQSQNAEFRVVMANLTEENTKLIKNQSESNAYKIEYKDALNKIANEMKSLKSLLDMTSRETKLFINNNKQNMHGTVKQINDIINHSTKFLETNIESTNIKYYELLKDFEKMENELTTSTNTNLKLTQDYDKLQKTVDHLEEKMKSHVLEQENAEEKLVNMTNLYEECLNEIKQVKLDNENLKININEVENLAQKSDLALINKKEEHDALLEKLKTLDAEKQNLQETVKKLDDENLKLNINLENAIGDHKDYVDKYNTLCKEYDELTKTKTINSQTTEELEISMKNKISEYEDVVEKLKLKDTDHRKLTQKLHQLETNYKQVVDQNVNVKREQEIAQEKIKELESEVFTKSNEIAKLQQHQTSLDEKIAQQVLIAEDLAKTNKEKQELLRNILELENYNKSTKEELEELRRNNCESNEKIKNLHDDISHKSKSMESHVIQINELQQKLETLSNENISLKSDATNFVSSISRLEAEIDDIKKSHAIIETEKDHLSNIIENLERKESLKNNDSKDTQTDEQAVVSEPNAVLENKWVLENKQSTMSNTASLNLLTTDHEDLFSQYNLLKNNYDTIKDENRRLKSDIEGLQTYLTKISKENSILNDKIRECIATSEHSIDSEELSNDVKNLKEEIEVNKEKINDLVRENSLLVEENLELKDQLQSQNYSKVEDPVLIPAKKDNNVLEIQKNNEKYDTLLQFNSQLQKRNTDLEQINRSVNGNMQQLQDKNERLKLSNEKLERRLDEALVSLRHLHSLQENTELEYLRNILYEYLTGSGTHSVTLAKVLSAIVKFDDSQTQMVLQKEKERQGFLRQLGLI